MFPSKQLYIWLHKWCKIQSLLLYVFSLKLFIFSLILFVFSHISYIFSLILFPSVTYYIQPHLICTRSDMIYIFSLILFVFSQIFDIFFYIFSLILFYSVFFLYSVSRTVREGIVQQVLPCSRFRNNQIELSNVKCKNTKIQKIEY